jgi:hypothetical protein
MEPSDESQDWRQLTNQLARVRVYMLQSNWRTLREIEDALGHPQASISARLRDLRKSRYGSYIVARRRREGMKVWEYRVMITFTCESCGAKTDNGLTLCQMCCDVFGRIDGGSCLPKGAVYLRAEPSEAEKCVHRHQPWKCTIHEHGRKPKN